MASSHDIKHKTPPWLSRYLISHTARLVTAVNTGIVSEFNRGLGADVRLASKGADFALKGRRFVANEIKHHLHGMRDDKGIEVRATMGEVRFKGDDHYPCVFVYEGGAPAGAMCLEIGRTDKKIKNVHILTDRRTVDSMSRRSSYSAPVLASA